MNIRPPLHPFRRLAALLALSLAASIVFAAPPPAPAAPTPVMPLTNPGFEEGTQGWVIQENDVTMSTLTAEAAHQGKLGLRIEDSDTKFGSSTESIPLAAIPGRSYRVSFYARSPGASDGCAVYLRFRNDRQHALPIPFAAPIPRHASDWTYCEFEAIAPTEAVSIAIWVHSYSTTTGVWEVDDLKLEELDGPGGNPVTPTIVRPAASAPAPDLTNLPPLPNPRPFIVLKLDDLVSTYYGDIPPRWKRITDFALERKLKLSVGIIANSLEGDKPAYFSYIKDLRKTGLVEFWFHGYDHKEWQDGGRKLQEFNGTSYEHQKEHFVKSQALAKEKLGFAFTTFGSPFNGSDATTARVLAEDSDLKVFLYGNAHDKTSGKIILDRVGPVNIEMPLFAPNAAKFIAAYHQGAEGRRYFVIQGHPDQWDDTRWNEFVKLVDYLDANHVPVVTPTELVAALGKS